MSNEYLSLSTLSTEGEELPEAIESPDFTTARTTTPGNYVSQTRTITVRKREDGHLSFKVELAGGVLDTGSGRSYNDRFPLVKYLSTKPYTQNDREGNPIPGKTSQVADYLKACGFDPKGLSLEALRDLMIESQAAPVQVYVSRTDRSKETTPGNWENANIKLQQWNAGTKETPSWLETVTVNGIEYRAKATVASFSRLK